MTVIILHKNKLIIVGLMLGLLAFSLPVQASIYLKVEDTGVFELTNSPSSKSYTLILESGSKSKIPEPDEVKKAVELASNRYHLPESIIYAMIRGNNTRSGGLMGLPDVVRKKMSDTQIQDPFVNIDTGTNRLYEMLGEFEGNLTLALAAYRGGVKKVRKVQGIPPYREIRKFVSDVRESFQSFEKRSEVIYTYKDEHGNITLVNIH